jgi:hypothetical protein
MSQDVLLTRRQSIYFIFQIQADLNSYHRNTLSILAVEVSLCLEFKK